MKDGQEPRQLVAYKPSEAIIESRKAPVIEELTSPGQGPMPLATYWYVLLKRRWTIIGITVLLTAIAAVVSFRATPVYEATARIEVDPERPLLQSQSLSDVYERVDVDDEFLETEMQVLKSQDLELQTIDQLGLAKHLGSTQGIDPTSDASAKQKVQLIGAFNGHLTVAQVPKTRMLAVSFRDSDPKLAAQVATALVNNYLEYNFRQKDESIRRSGWMGQEVESLKANVERSQQALVTYEQQNQIVNSDDKQNILEQMLGDRSRDLSAATSERIQKESLYRQVTANRAQMTSLVHDDLLEKLEERAADLKQQYTQTASQYGPNFPNAKRLQLQITDNQNQIHAEQDRIINRFASDYNAASDREKIAADSVANQKTEVGRLHQLLVQDNILRHEFETNQQLYDSLLQRLKDATVSAALRSTNIHLVDEALPPETPVRPRKLLNIVAAFWAGLVIGIIVVFGREVMDSSIKTAEEAEALMLTPALGFIPLERGSWFRWTMLGQKAKNNQFGLSLTERPNSSLSEAFRALGTAVSVPSMPVRSLLVTSAQSGEGKTTTALNLAQALAQRKGPVLLMDCDLRKGGVAQAIGQKNCQGLTAVLSGEIGIADALIAVQPNLWLLAAGKTPADSVAMLSSQEMAALFGEACSRFEFVIIDSPPVLAVTDAAILAGLVDGVLLVAASGITAPAGLVRARRILEATGAKILGLAVNKLDPRRVGYGYSYSYK